MHLQTLIVSNVSDILESGSDDFESGEDIHDAVGNILTEVSGDEGEEDIIDICNQLMGALKGYVEQVIEFHKNFVHVCPQNIL